MRNLSARAGVGALVVTGVLVCAFTAFAPSLSTAKPATGNARSAAACATERVNGGKYLGELTLRFGFIGHVSCAQAHSLARTYFHKYATGHCHFQHNNFCNLQLPGGWDCSIFSATESQQAGGAKAGCAQEPGGARVRFYWGKKQSVAGRCRANALGISLRYVGAYSFHTGFAIEFKNRGSACTITGYPGVHALSAKGRRILTAKRTKSGYIGGVFSGPIPKVHLAKGKTASALVEWSDGKPVGVPCPHARSLSITPPGAVSSVTFSPKLLKTETLCGLQVHPVVPGRSGRKT